MLVERSEITVNAGEEEAFLDMLGTRIRPLLLDVPGVTAVTFGRGVENPAKFALLVTWQSLDMHEAFRALPANGELRRLIGPVAAAATMEHFEMA